MNQYSQTPTGKDDIAAPIPSVGGGVADAGLIWREVRPHATYYTILDPGCDLPPIYRYVLVKLDTQVSNLGAVGVGYLKFSGGDSDAPFFVVPGVPGKPTHWCDCLPGDFAAPDWCALGIPITRDDSSPVIHHGESTESQSTATLPESDPLPTEGEEK